MDYAFERKQNDSISGLVDNKINVILFDRKDKAKDYKLVGTSAYRLSKYYGDIDVLEIFKIGEKDIDKLVNKFISSLKTVLQQIKKARVSYFTDFKAGKDDRYDVNVELIQDGPDVYSTNSEYILEASKNLYNQKLLTSDEMQFIYFYLDNFSLNSYYSLKDFFRSKQNIKWTEKEILAGKKKIAGGKVVTLKEELMKKAIVKIDYVTTIGDQFIEMTNYVLMGYVTKNNISLINAPEEKLVTSMRKDVEKFLFTDYHYNALKGIKRMFNISRILWEENEDKEEISRVMEELIIPIATGDAAYLSQMGSRLDAISLIKNKLPKASVNKQLELIKFGLPNCLLLDEPMISKFNKLIDSAISSTKDASTRTLLDKITNLMEVNINYFVVSYMYSKGYETKKDIKLYLPEREYDDYSDDYIEDDSDTDDNYVPFRVSDVDIITSTNEASSKNKQERSEQKESLLERKRLERDNLMVPPKAVVDKKIDEINDINMNENFTPIIFNKEAQKYDLFNISEGRSINQPSITEEESALIDNFINELAEEDDEDDEVKSFVDLTEELLAEANKEDNPIEFLDNVYDIFKDSKSGDGIKVAEAAQVALLSIKSKMDLEQLQ